MKISGFKSKTKFLKQNFKALGFIEGTRALILYRCKKWLSYRPKLDRKFDKKYKTDTSISVSQDELGIVDANDRKAATSYVSAPVSIQNYIYRRL